MTVGTNALLEGRVARTALLATEGFTDLEELGRQARPELYRLCVGHPPPIVRELRVAVPERTGPDGVLRAARRGRAASGARRARLRGGRGLPAVGLPPPRARAARGRAGRGGARRRARVDLARDRGRVPRVRALRDDGRGRRALAAAARLPRAAGRARRRGRPARARGDAVERGHGERGHRGPPRLLDGAVGPRRRSGGRGAGGGRADAVGLDMGGTSCDVSLVLGGSAAVGGGRSVGGRALALPMVDVHTVGAGGGSIAWRDAGGALRVGPRSAGADPGPACYGRGGERADGDRRRPAAGLARRRVAAGRRGARSTPRRPPERSGGLAGELGLSAEEAAAGIARVAARRWPRRCGW